MTSLSRKINIYPSIHDSEEAIHKWQLALESMHSVTDCVIFEVGGNCNDIQLSLYSTEYDEQIINGSLAAYLPRSYVHQEIAEPDETLYHCYSFITQAPFYTCLTPPEQVMSPLIAIVDLL